MIRVIVGMTLMPDARPGEVITALAGDLAMVPWARPWRPASERACLDWRNALGPEPLEELQAIVLRASHREHDDRDWRAVMVGREEPLRAGSLDGTLIRVPDTAANRAMYGSAGTGDGSSPFPQLRALPLLDAALEQYPHLFTRDRIWLMDRLWHGTARIARLIECTHVLIRVKSDITLKKTSPVLGDGSYLADLSGDGATITVRVIEYFAEVDGQVVPEMFCLVTGLLDISEYPAPELAALYKWRWDGSETALREAKASLHGAGPGTGPMLRSGSPALVRQELAAWAAATEMTRGVTRDAALTATPSRQGRCAGQPVRPRDLSHARARRAVLTAIRAGHACYQALTRDIGKHRNTCDRNRHRARKSKSPSTFGHATAKDTATRIAPAVITMANTPT
jgi:hypothetical protein